MGENADGAAQELAELEQYVEVLQEKLLQVSNDHREHARVAAALEELSGERVAYRLIGEVLVKQTVAEILPHLQETMRHLGDMAGKLEKQLGERSAALRDLQEKRQASEKGE